MDKITVILADDHPVVRTGIKSLINESDDIEIVAEASDGKEALELVETKRPNVLITDISMPHLTGIELAEKVNDQFSETKVLVLTMHMEEEYILKGFEAGILGYLPKDSSQSELLEAIQTISYGQKYLTKAVSGVLAQSMIKGGRRTGGQQSLTEREKQILKLLVNGSRNKEIAEALFISVRTVDTHRTNIMRKLKVNNTAELVKTAISKKLA